MIVAGELYKHTSVGHLSITTLTWLCMCVYMYIYIYRVSKEECVRILEGVPYSKL